MATVRLMIDGREVEVQTGTTLLEAALCIGLHTPTLCYHSEMHCGSNCRACLMELEGSRTLVPSCSRETADGMKVQTDSPRVRRARKLVLELLLSELDLSAAPSLLAYADHYEARSDRFPLAHSAARARPVINENPFFVRDYARCIACQRCTRACGDDIQHTFAIAMVGRGHEISVGAGSAANDLTDSPCVFCGNCVGACPTGALTPLREYDLRESGDLPDAPLAWTPERGLAQR